MSGGVVIVVIDGYNLIKQVLGVKRVSQKERDKFISKIANYLYKKHVEGVIVFDGGSSNFPYQEKHGGMTVIFSGYKETADEVIAQYVQKHREYQLLIVSSDRAVRQYAESLGKQSLKAPDFYYTYLQKTDVHPQHHVSKDDTAFKIHDSSTDLDNLMMAGSEMIELKDEDASSEKRGSSSQKLSKKERKLKKVLNKLD